MPKLNSTNDERHPTALTLEEEEEVEIALPHSEPEKDIAYTELSKKLLGHREWKLFDPNLRHQLEPES